MARVLVAMYRFEREGPGRKVTGFLEAHHDGSKALQRALEDLVAIMVANIRRQGVPKAGYGISLSVVPNGEKIDVDTTTDPSTMLDSVLAVDEEPSGSTGSGSGEASQGKPQ